MTFADLRLAASEDESLSPADLRALLHRAGLRLGKGEGKKPAREIVARSLCRLAGNPENTKFGGHPMWESYLREADAIVAALNEDTKMTGSA